MGEVAVLPPQDYLKHRLSHENFGYPAIKSRGNPNPNPNFTRSNRRRKIPTGLQRINNKSKVLVLNQAPKNPVMGQVKILKRGQVLKESTDAAENRKETLKPVRNQKKITGAVENRVPDLMLPSTERLGPKPEMMPKPMTTRMADFYAGSAVIASPSPSSLPLPAFFTKKCVVVADKKEEEYDPSADLRRILGLSL